MAGSSGQIMIGKSILRSRLSAEIMIDVDCTICFFLSHTSRLKDLIPLVACLMNFLVESNFFRPEIISIDFQTYMNH